MCLVEKLDRRPQKEELWRIAIHEVGHAVVGEILKPGSVAALTIVSRGQALGYTRQTPENDYYLYTETYLREQIRILLAGFVAEELVFGTVSTGAQGDLEHAVAIAQKMIRSGMSSLELVPIGEGSNTSLQKAIGCVLEQEKKLAAEILTSLQEEVVAIATYLTDKERMDGDKLQAMLEKRLRLQKLTLTRF